MRDRHGCGSKGDVETYGDGMGGGGGASARKIEFELFVMAILDHDREIELVAASLWDGVSPKSPDYEADFVAVRRGGLCWSR